jgi:fructose-1-phosphate kinase PfkB-like protein
MKNSSIPILIIGLNSVWQKNIGFSALELGEVHRAKETECFVSGKGANVAQALSCCGSENIHLIQTVGGSNGSLLLKASEQLPFQVHHVQIQGESRSCSTLLEDSGRCTELIEPSPVLTQGEWQACVLELEKLMFMGPCHLVVSGSLPDGDAQLLFERLKNRKSDQHLWVDSVDARWLALQPEVLKVNEDELRTLWNGTIDKTDSRLLAHDMSTSNILKVLCEHYGICRAVVTAEEREGLAFEGGDVRFFRPPKADPLVNVIGAGDTFLAGLLHAELQGLDWEKSINFGARLASKKCGVAKIHDLEPCPLL